MRHVFAARAEEEVAQRHEAGVAAVSEDRHESPDDFPPVSHGGTSQVREAIAQLVVGDRLLRVANDRDAAEQL
jgi:hypothetical protein